MDLTELSGIEDPDPIRVRLFAAARAEFLRHGYAAANVGRIATDAGISKKTVYKYVASKEALLFAVMEDSLLAPLERIGPLDIAVEPAERLAAYLTSFAALAFSQEGVISYRLVLAEGVRFPELVSTYLASINDHAIRPLAETIALYQRDGRLRPVNPATAASMLFAMVMAEPMRDAALGLRPAPDAGQTRQLVEAAIDFAMNGLKISP